MSSVGAQTPDPEQPKKKGPWANRVVHSEVVHTPEYDAFMEKLAAYHEKRGCVHSKAGVLPARALACQRVAARAIGKEVVPGGRLTETNFL